MKKGNKVTLVVLMIVGVFLHSCQNQDDFSFETEGPVAEIDSSKLIDFKGIMINHRFDTPLNVLVKEHTLADLKEMYREAKKRLLNKNSSNLSVNNDPFLNPLLILEAAKDILHLFPYEYVIDDSENMELNSEQEVMNRWDMIKQDFSTLSDAQINENIEIIEEYYTKNLSYLVVTKLAENEEKYIQGIVRNPAYSASSNDSCFTNILENLGLSIIGPLSIIKAGIALAIVGKKPQKYAGEYYSGKYYGDGGSNGGNNTRGDAYRHTI